MIVIPNAPALKARITGGVIEAVLGAFTALPGCIGKLPSREVPLLPFRQVRDDNRDDMGLGLQIEWQRLIHCYVSSNGVSFLADSDPRRREILFASIIPRSG